MAKNYGIVGPFNGIDLQRDAAMSDQASLRIASNVSLRVGGNLARRDALIKLCDVSTETVGLYASDNQLRTVCPGGQSLQDTRPSEIWYDVIGDGTAYPLGELSKFHAVEHVSAASGGRSYPYVVLEKTDGRIEHHWLNGDPATSAAAVDTKVPLPFDPGKSLVKSQNKLFCDDPSAGVLRFSASTTTPKDWTKARDAGFLAVRNQSAGSRDIVALSYFRSYVSVVFKDSIQLWQMSPDPAKFEFINAFNGPGTETPRLTTNVLGDMFYFNRGGFRSMARSSTNGDDLAEDIGAKIAALTSVQSTAITPVSVWSESRSQYLAAFGTSVYVMTYSPANKTVGWTTWTLPVQVDHWAELDGILYIRSGVGIYKFDPSVVNDTAGSVNFEVVPAFQAYGYPGRKKRWDSLDVVQTGASKLNFLIDATEPTVTELSAPINIVGTTFQKGKIGINRTCDFLSLRFTGTAIWTLDSAILTAKVLGGVG
jgi:hypothetical protein